MKYSWMRRMQHHFSAIHSLQSAPYLYQTSVHSQVSAWCSYMYLLQYPRYIFLGYWQQHDKMLPVGAILCFLQQAVLHSQLFLSDSHTLPGSPPPLQVVVFFPSEAFSSPVLAFLLDSDSLHRPYPCAVPLVCNALIRYVGFWIQHRSCDDVAFCGQTTALDFWDRWKHYTAVLGKVSWLSITVADLASVGCSWTCAPHNLYWP